MEIRFLSDTTPSKVHAAALTDIGRVRSNNEDTFDCDPALGLYVVCDGMGGMASGEVASHIASRTLIKTYATQPADTPPELRLINAIHAANDVVFRGGQTTEHQGMGTTLVAAAFLGNHLLIGNVGDSRAYILPADPETPAADRVWHQLTVDHSYINELIQSGNIRASDHDRPELHRFSSLITRAIGAGPEVEPDLFSVNLSDGDTILLSSDGLTRYLAPADFSRLIDPHDLKASCQRLVDAAKHLGGIDNITCFLLHYGAE